MSPTFSLHQGVVAILRSRYEDVQTRSFKRSLIAALGEESETAEWVRERWSRVPDAYILDEADQRVVLFEVEDSHPIDAAKMHDLVQLWFYLDCEFWNLVLVSVNRYGREEQVRLVDFYYANLAQGAV